MKLVLMLFTLLLAPPHMMGDVWAANCDPLSLKSLIQAKISPDQARAFLALQGQITMHKLAYAYLRQQKADETKRLESLQETIVELLRDKHTNSDPDFQKARALFEAQPLSRTALAAIAPYLRDTLAAEYGKEEKLFQLDDSDLKLLSAAASFETQNSDSRFDHRMLAGGGKRSMLNFMTVINSSYKTALNPQEVEFGLDLRLRGLESVISELSEQLDEFIAEFSVPTECMSSQLQGCNLDNSLNSVNGFSDDIEAILWDMLKPENGSEKLLLSELSYGNIWLKTNTPRAKTSPPTRSIKVGARGLPQTQNKAQPKVQTTKQEESNGLTTPLVVRDPLSVIKKDSPHTNREHFKKFDAKFLNTMADAVVENKQIFVYQNNIYDRKTGRHMPASVALGLLPPDERKKVQATLQKMPENIRPSFLEAVVNNKKSFVVNDRLYNLDGKELDPAIVINLQLYEKNKAPFNLKSFDRDYLARRAEALLNKELLFRVGAKTYHSETGRHISSHTLGRSVSATKKEKISKAFSTLPDEDLIINFHRLHPLKECPHYGVIDKKNAVLNIYEMSGRLVKSFPVLVGASGSDERTRWTDYSSRQPSRSTGAGVYTVKKKDPNDKFNKTHFNNNIISFEQINGLNMVFAIHQVPNNLQGRYKKFNTGNPSDRRGTGGCANVKAQDFSDIEKFLGVACKVYVLPEEEGNKFVVRDNQLHLSFKNSSTNLYNQTTPQDKAAPIKIKLAAEADNIFTEPFAKTLEQEKEKLMKLFGLSNDEYNNLAMLAVAIMGNESEFGKSKKLYGKETLPPLVVLGKLFKSATEDGPMKWDDVEESFNLSKGYTQIKFLPKKISEAYPKVSKSTLIIPSHSAVATLGYLAEAFGDLERMAAQNRKDPRKIQLTRQNMMDYIGYLYQGGRKKVTTEVKDKQATPDFNQYYQKLMRNMEKVDVIQIAAN